MMNGWKRSEESLCGGRWMAPAPVEAPTFLPRLRTSLKGRRYSWLLDPFALSITQHHHASTTLSALQLASCEIPSATAVTLSLPASGKSVAAAAAAAYQWSDTEIDLAGTAREDSALCLAETEHSHADIVSSALVSHPILYLFPPRSVFASCCWMHDALRTSAY